MKRYVALSIVEEELVTAAEGLYFEKIRSIQPLPGTFPSLTYNSSYIKFCFDGSVSIGENDFEEDWDWARNIYEFKEFK